MDNIYRGFKFCFCMPVIARGRCARAYAIGQLEQGLQENIKGCLPTLMERGPPRAHACLRKPLGILEVKNCQ